MDISLPILVFDGGDLAVFDSLDVAETSIEALDVLDGGLFVMDAVGKRLNLSAKSRFGPVRIVPVDVPDEVAVRDLLLQYLKYCGIHTEEVMSLKLDELIAQAKLQASKC